ncbi:Glycerophosphoryl diester phosphodiesterase family domain-containing protein [Trichoderma evansii]
MKFGLHFHQHLLAKWSDDYVDYNGLRQMIRLASQREELPAEVLKCLGESMQSFETSHQRKHASIIQREAGLCATIGLPSTPADIPDTYIVEQSELGLILFVYEELLREVHEVEWFDRVNETAITKIFGKIASRFRDEKSGYHHLQSQWLAMQQSLENLRVETQKRFSNIIADIRRVCSMTRQPTRSLYISAFIWVDRAPENSYNWIKNDNFAALREYYLSNDPPISTRQSEFERQFYSLFIAAIMMEAKESANFLLMFVTEQDWAMHTDQMFFFLGFCGYMKQNGSRATPTPEDWLVKLFNRPGALTAVFLRNKDIHGRLALHYAAKYGLESFAKALTRCAINSSDENLVDILSRRDDDGMTPLHYAVLSGETSLLAILLKGLVDFSDKKQSKFDPQLLFGDLLLLSVRSSQDDIAKILLNHQLNINHTTRHGETALYCAAQANNVDLVKLLLTYTQRGLDANIAAATGWTPLMVACANGHSDVVSCLLEAGTEPESCDALGWTAREHAVFRGHLGIAMLFKSTASESIKGGPASSSRMNYKRPPQNSFNGSSEKLVVVNLGSTQGGHDRAAFELSHYNSQRSCGTEATSSLVLEISAPGTSADAKVVRLPVLEDQINQPFIFQAKNEAPLQISVRLFRRESIDSMVLLSRGNTTLDHGKVFFGNKRESMIREVTVFMMDKETMDLTGTVMLSYVVATPFAGLRQPDTANYQRQLGDPVRIVGHRGLGQNTDSRSYLQLGENTAMEHRSLRYASHLSKDLDFIITHNLQITRDLEAVIFHDFSLSESGTDVAIHDVTLAQYRHASDLQEPQSITPATIDKMNDGLHTQSRRRRAWSTGEESRLRTVQLRDRLRYTVDFQSKGFKPNTRGDFIQGSLTTLDELLVDLPEDIGFNIEMKYPRLHEAVDAGVAPVTIDINTFVDVALEKIQRLAGNRPIILSSFTPEVCILLSVKQKTYPVMFITNAGKVPMADKELRVASLQVGVQFARLWNLAGVVFACEALLYCPRLVQFVKRSGLVCASYGLLNNEPILARKQADAGVDIIMVDRVKLVADELTNDVIKSHSLN